MLTTRISQAVRKHWRRGAIGGVAVLVAATALTAGLGPAAAQSEERKFEPAFPMSKQYVAVVTYKVLRDHAPQLITTCAKNVKTEPDQFTDLDGAMPFTRGAINCLGKNGYLASNLPGITGTGKNRTFDPAYKMSKQYVAVVTYKVLREHAPTLIASCAKNVKTEPNDRFTDLNDFPENRLFTRGAINCLDKNGYLAGNLPGISGGGPSTSMPETFSPSDFPPATEEPTSS